MVTAEMFETVYFEGKKIQKDADLLHDYCFRLAKLSEGQLVDGRLECLYHGWQFEGEGKCVKIPQVNTNPTILLLFFCLEISLPSQMHVSNEFLSQICTSSFQQEPKFLNKPV